VLLLYLAISGIFMIKGKLGLRGRGGALITVGIAVPILYVVLSGGPSAQPAKERDDDGERPARRDTRAVRPAPAPSKPAELGSDVLKPLPPDD